MEASLPQSAVSEDGYIVDQEQCGALRYGAWRSDRNGCGWIAAYNLMHATGKERSMAAVRRSLLRRSLLRGLLGTRMIAIYWYLRHCGYRPGAAMGKDKIAALARHARAGILLYRHREGWHYVCFLPDPTGNFRFLNAWTGPRDPVQSMNDFIAANARSRLLLALTV